MAGRLKEFCQFRKIPHIGLTISRQLAELLGGTLKAQSSSGQGSTFTLELPIIPVQAPWQEEVSQPPAESSFKGFRVLLAEDNPVNQLVAKEMLETMAAEVGVAGNGADAVNMAACGGYHIILMDLQMPGMDGITATREIRLHERQTGQDPVPIIAMTGNSRDDYGKACREAGMNGFLAKPIRLREFHSVLERLETGL